MLNQIVLVGKLHKELEIEELESGKRAIITLEIPRSWKNAEGEYEKDFIECTAFGNVAERTLEYCKKGDVIGIKGRIQSDLIADNDGNIISKTQSIIAEKVTFLSNKKVGEE